MESFGRFRESQPNPEQEQTYDTNMLKQLAKEQVDIARRQVTRNISKRDVRYKRAKSLADDWKGNIDRIRDNKKGKGPERSLEQILTDTRRQTRSKIEDSGCCIRGKTLSSNMDLLRKMKANLPIRTVEQQTQPESSLAHSQEAHEAGERKRPSSSDHTSLPVVHGRGSSDVTDDTSRFARSPYRSEAGVTQNYRMYAPIPEQPGLTDTPSQQPYRGISEVALGKQRDISVPLENLKDAKSVGKRELLQDAQINIWEGHLQEGEVADLMITGKVISSETLDSSEEAEKITLDSGIVGVFKPDWDDPANYTPEDDRWFSYQLEIAAFQMDKKLGLGMVPLTVEREINGKQGSFQLWVNDLTFPSSVELPNNAQFFDFLIHQEDRFDEGDGDGYSNVGYNPNQVPVLYDNSRTFSPAITHHLDAKDISKILPDPHIIENARKLNMEALEDIQCLTLKRKQALLYRRDWLLQGHQPI